MSRPEAQQGWICPECGATLDRGAGICWLCRADVTPVPGPVTVSLVEDASAGRTAAAEYGERAHLQFGLASLMLVVTLVSVICSVSAMMPGLGIALAVLSAPALIQTAVTAARRRARGQAMTIGDKIAVFGGALGAAAVTAVAAGAAFFATCFAGFWGGAFAGEALGAKGYDSLGWGFVIGGILGVIAAAGVATFVIRRWIRFYRRRQG